MHSCPTFWQLLSDADLISKGAKLVYLLVCGLGIGTWVESDDVSQVQECKNQDVNILGKGRFINTTACEPKLLSTPLIIIHVVKQIQSNIFFCPRILTPTHLRL